MSRVKLTTKLWISFGALLVVLVATLGVYEWQIQRINNRINQLSEVQLPAEQAVWEIQEGRVLIAQALTNYEREKEPTNIQQLRSAEISLTQAVVKYDTLVNTGTVENQIQDTNKITIDFVNSADQVILLVDQQQTAYLSVHKQLDETSALVQGMISTYGKDSSPDSNQILATALNIRSGLDKISRDIEVYLAQPDTDVRQQVLNTGEDIKQLSASIQDITQTPLASTWLEQLNTRYVEFIDNCNILFSANDALATGMQHFEDLSNEIGTTLDRQIQYAGTATLSSINILKDSANSAGIWIIILCVIGTAAVATAVIVISRQVNRPIREIIDKAGLVGSGRIDNRFNTEATGEFGQLSFSLNKMLDNIKRSRDALMESEELAWEILDATNDAVVLIDTNGTILASNEIAASRFNRSLEQMIDLYYYDLLSTESAASLKAHVTEILKTQKPLHYEDEPEDKIIEHDVFPVFGHRGDISRIAIFSRDITMRKWVEDVTEQLGRRNASILESAGEGIFGLDTEGRTTFVNPSGARMLGYLPEELKGKKHHDIVHHSKPDGKLYPYEMCPIYATFKDGNNHCNIDNEVFWRKDGSSFQVEYSSTPIIENGRVLGAVVTFRDISDRKRLEKALRESEEKYRSVIESTASLVVWLDRSGTIIDSNSRVEQLLGYSRSEIIGRPFKNFIHPEYRIHVEDLFIEAISGASEHDYHIRLVTNKDSYIEVSMNIGIAHDASGNYAYTICMISEANLRV